MCLTFFMGQPEQSFEIEGFKAFFELSVSRVVLLSVNIRF